MGEKTPTPKCPMREKIEEKRGRAEDARAIRFSEGRDPKEKETRKSRDWRKKRSGEPIARRASHISKGTMNGG